MVTRCCLAKQSASLVMVLATLLGTTLILGGCEQKQAVLGNAVALLNQKAQTLVNQGNPAAAVARLESALDLMPKQAATLHNLAVAYQANHQYEQAIDTYRELTLLEPKKKADYLKSMGIAYEDQGNEHLTQWQASKEQDAETACKTSMEKSPLHHKEQALTALQSAQGAYRQAIDANPDFKGPLEQQIRDLDREIAKLQKDAVSQLEAID